MTFLPGVADLADPIDFEISYYANLLLIVAKKVADYCQSHSINVSQLGLNYSVKSSPDVHTTLVGIQSNAILDSNLEALTIKYDQKIIEELAKIIKPVHNKTWSSGLPENNTNLNL